jgi:hypothetical protein
MRQRLEELVRARLEIGAEAWPAVTLILHDHVVLAHARHGTWMMPELFADHALDHVTRGSTPRETLLSRLSTLHSVDLYLALAAAHAVPAALARLDEDHVTPICNKVVSGDVDVVVHLRARLRAPERLRGYAGRSALRDWLRVIAARDLRDLRRLSAPSCTDPSSPSRRRLRRSAEASGAFSR